MSIDWEVLIRLENLSDATVRVSTRDPSLFRGDSTGTRITISDLRERNWTRGEVRRLQRQVTSISSPFEGGSDEFYPWLEVPGHEDWVTGVPDVTALMERAPWKFQFRFEDGRFDWKYRFPRDMTSSAGRSWPSSISPQLGLWCDHSSTRPSGCESRSATVAPAGSSRSGRWRQRHGLKHSDETGREGDSATLRAATRVNAEQALRRVMRKPTRR